MSIVTTLSLAREALEHARAEHRRAQAANIKHRQIWSKSALRQAEAKLAAAERGNAAAAIVASTQRWV